MLKPKDWPVGMRVRYAPHLPEDDDGVVIRNDELEGLVYVRFSDGDVDDWGLAGAEENLTPLTYADLDREPVEGERAVVLDAIADCEEPGQIYTVRLCDYGHSPRPHFCGGKDGMFAYLYDSSDFAPLADLGTPAEKPTRKIKPVPPQCDLINEDVGHAASCASYWLRGHHPDPCVPCAAEIDRIEAERARTAGRCPHLWPANGVACPDCPGGRARAEEPRR